MNRRKFLTVLSAPLIVPSYTLELTASHIRHERSLSPYLSALLRGNPSIRFMGNYGDMAYTPSEYAIEKDKSH